MKTIVVHMEVKFQELKTAQKLLPQRTQSAAEEKLKNTLSGPMVERLTGIKKKERVETVAVLRVPLRPLR
jgi:hypothetical protein